MSAISEEYLAREHGDKMKASTELCLDLMRGDKATLKAGYSIGNALLVAIDLFNLTAREVALVADRIEKQRAEE